MIVTPQINYFIYELIDPITNETRYIGKAKNPTNRFSGHLNDKSFTYKTNWIKSLNKKGLKPILNTIDEVRRDEVNFWEIFYISLYKSWGCRLTNFTKGGDGGSTNKGKKFSKNWKENISFGKTEKGKKIKKEELLNKKKSFCGLNSLEVRRKAVKTRKKNYPLWHSERTKQKISKKHLGKKLSNEHKQKISNTCKGKPSNKKGKKDSKETCLKKSLSHIGNTLSIQVKEKISKKNKKTWEKRSHCSKRKNIPNSKLYKKVLQFDLKENFIKEFKSVKSASEELKIHSNGIIDCCKKRIKSCKNFIFKYGTVI